MCSEFLTWFPSQQSDATEIMMTTVAGIVMIALAIGICIGAVFYVVQALAMYQMATRRKISNPWLAWVPVGNLWILGSLSDQYAYLTQARNQRRRILMPVLKAVCVVASILSISLRPFVNAHIIPHGGTFPYGIYTLVGSIASVVYVGTSVAYLIYYCICLYNIYRSCDPSTATVYLVISILFPVACPFLLLSSRKHEMGMPPRRDQAFGGNPRSYAPGGNYQSGPYAPGGNYQSGPYAPGGNYQSGPYAPGGNYQSGPYAPGGNYQSGPYAPGGNYQSGPYAPGGNYQSGPYAPGGNYQSGPYAPGSNYQSGPYAPGSNYQSEPSSASDCDQTAPLNQQPPCEQPSEEPTDTENREI